MRFVFETKESNQVIPVPWWSRGNRSRALTGIIQSILFRGASWVLVLSLTGCTALGYTYGKRIDGSQLHPVDVATVDGSMCGRQVEIRGGDGKINSGRLVHVCREPGATLFIVERERVDTLLGTVDRFSDTLSVSMSDSIFVGGGPGTGAVFGLMSGLALDIFVLRWLDRIGSGLEGIGEQ